MQKHTGSTSKGFSALSIVIGGMVVVIIVCIAAFTLGYQAGHSSPVIVTPTPIPIQTVMQSPSPTFIPITPYQDPTLNWTVYTNKTAGYTIKFPPDWTVKVNESNALLTGQDYVTSLQAYPTQTAFGTQDPNAVSVDIDYPITIQPPHVDVGKLYELGLKGLEKYSIWGSSAVQYAFYVKVDNLPALTVKAVSPATPVAGFGGQWCDHCTNKYYYIQLDNNRILTIEAFWGKNKQDVELTFDKIVSTFQVKNF